MLGHSSWLRGRRLVTLVLLWLWRHYRHVTAIQSHMQDWHIKWNLTVCLTLTVPVVHFGKRALLVFFGPSVCRHTRMCTLAVTLQHDDVFLPRPSPANKPLWVIEVLLLIHSQIHASKFQKISLFFMYLTRIVHSKPQYRFTICLYCVEHIIKFIHHVQ